MPYVRGLFNCQKYVTVIMKWRTKAASALNHPNIVTVFEVVRWEQTVAIAMELVQYFQVLKLICESEANFPI